MHAPRAAFGLLLAASAVAQPEWRAGVVVPASFVGRYGHGLVFDRARDRVVLFGGSIRSTYGYLNDTWECDGAAWVPGPPAPPSLEPRARHAMAYDVARGRTVLFSGYTDGPNPEDTWEYDGTAWQEIQTSGPSRRYSAGMAYDELRGYIVLQGGWYNGTKSDTWHYDGVWTAAAPGPSRSEHGMAFDGNRGVIVSFSGYPPNGGSTETWEYDGVQWTLVPAAPPGMSGRQGPGMAFDADRDRTVLFGGRGLFNLDDTWEYDGAAWSAPTLTTPSPPERQFPGMTFAFGRVWLVGGTGLTLGDDVWEFGCDAIGIAPATLPDGVVGAPYAETLTAGGGVAPYVWRVLAASLPPGLGLSPSGVLSGTPTAPAFASFTVAVSDAVGCASSRAYEILTTGAGCPGIAVSPPSLPVALVQAAYGQTLTASGGSGPYVFSVATGSLPPGITLAATGALTGTPSRTGTFRFSVLAEDAAGCGGARDYVLEVEGCFSITIDPAVLPTATVGYAYAATLAASGGTAPHTFAATGGTLPPGTALSPSGIVSGTPTIAGAYVFTVTATDALGCSGSAQIRLAVAGCPPFSLAPASIPPGTIGTGYYQVIAASGGTAPYRYRVTAGALPPGLALTTYQGELVGTPMAAGAYAFTIEARDAYQCTGTAPYSLVIGAGPSAGGDILAGQGFGQPNPNRVRAFDGLGQATPVDFLAYGAGQWGVAACGAELTASAPEELLTGPGPGPSLGPQVRGFRRDGTPIGNLNFYAYGTLKSGVNVAAGELDGDGRREIVVGPGPGEVFGPHVRGFDYDGSGVRAIAKVSFYAYGTLRYGVNVSLGDVDGDAFGEIECGAGAGPTFGAQVRGFDYDGVAVVPRPGGSFLAFATTGYGVNVAAGDLDGDGLADLACTPGPGPAHASRFLGFDVGGAVAALPGCDVTPFATVYGGRVAVGSVVASDPGKGQLLAGAGRDPLASSTIRVYKYDGALLVPALYATPFLPGYGVNPGAATLGY